MRITRKLTCCNCDSEFTISFHRAATDSEEPSFCPFCGESVEELPEWPGEDDEE